MEEKENKSLSSIPDHNNEDRHEVFIDNSTTQSSTKTQRVVDSKIRKTILLTLMFVGTFLALFPNAGLGPVLGSIASGLNDSKNMSWYMTVFLLASTITQLLSMRISDCLGRRRTLLTSTCLAFVFSLIGGFSVNSEMFIVCRLIQGCTMGAVISITTAALVDLFDIKDRLKYQPLIITSFGISFIIGPMLGSVFVDHLSWRFIFWFTAILFVPVNIGFYYLIDIPLKTDQSLSKENLKTLMLRIDPVGCFFIASSMTLFLLAMHLGSESRDYTWSSPLVIGFFAGFGLLLLVFLAFEKFITPNPLFPSSIVLDIHLMLCYIQQFFCGWNFILCDLLAFIQYQATSNLTPTEASMQMLPAAIIHIVATIATGKITHKFENPKAITIVGNILNVLAVFLMLFIQKIDTNTVTKAVIMTLFQIGMALCSVASSLCYQVILEKKAPHLVATSTSLARCAMSCGNTMGAAFVLSFLQSQSTASLQSLQTSQPNTYNEIVAYGAAYNYDKIKDVPSMLARQTLNLMYFENTRNILYGFLVSSLISFLSSIFAKIPSVPKKPLEKTSEK